MLIAKRDIFKGEEILFDYDGQGILGKQFSWINDEKKIQTINYNKDKNNINNHKNSNNNSNNNNIIIIDNNPEKKETMPKKTHLHSAIKSITNKPIVIEDNENEEENNNKDKDKTEILINPCFNNLFNGKNNINKNQDASKENNLIPNNEKNTINNKKIEKKEEPEKKEIPKINILNKPSFVEQPKKVEKNLEISETKNKNIKNNSNININNNIANNKPKNNLIDLLSEANLNPKTNNNNKNTNNNPKVIFKTEEDDIMSLRNNFNRGNGHNIFDWMNRLGENLGKNKFINKKRTIEKPQENQNNEPDLNLNFTPNINTTSENLNQIIINNNNQPKLDLEPSSSSKLRKPVFVGESMDESEENISEKKVEQKNYYINSKIRYNFITCQNIKIIDSTKNSNINNQNIFTKNYYKDKNKNTNLNNNININLGGNKTTTPEKDNNINTINKIFKYFQIGVIRIILELDNNPILNDFKFYSTVYTNILKNIESIKCKMVKLNELNIDVDLEKDIYGYLANNTINKGFRIFNDYLNLFENTCYYCQLSQINADLYIVSNGVLFDKIRERVELKNSKIKKLLFFIKKKE